MVLTLKKSLLKIQMPFFTNQLILYRVWRKSKQLKSLKSLAWAMFPNKLPKLFSICTTFSSRKMPFLSKSIHTPKMHSIPRNVSIFQISVIPLIHCSKHLKTNTSITIHLLLICRLCLGRKTSIRWYSWIPAKGFVQTSWLQSGRSKRSSSHQIRFELHCFGWSHR